MASLRSSGTGTSAAASSQRAMVQAVVGQLMISSNDDEDDDPVKKANLVFPVLESWYDNQYPKGQRRRPSGSPVKKRARKSGSDEDEGNVRPPLVIILEDFEGFPAGLLQDFVLNVM